MGDTDKNNNTKNSLDNESGEEDSEPVQFIEREENTKKQGKQEEKDKDKKEDKGTSQTTAEAQDKTKKKEISEEIHDAIKNSREEETEEKLFAYTRKKETLSFSIWNVDEWLHYTYKETNVILRTLIELTAVFILIFLPSIPFIIGMGKALPISELLRDKKITPINDPAFIFKFALFTYSWYLFDTLVLLFSNNSVLIFGYVLECFILSKSEFMWSLVDNFYMSRGRFRLFISFFFVFKLMVSMYGVFERPHLTEPFDLNIIKAQILWMSAFSGLLFITKFFLSVLVYNIRSATYKDVIKELNYKIYIFKTLNEFSTMPKYSISEYAMSKEPTFDLGLYLKDSDFFTSENDAKIVANNIFYNFNVKKLGYSDIKTYFPNDYEKIFTYLIGNENFKDTDEIDLRTFKNRAKDLFLRRKNLSYNIQDNNYIFELLEKIVTVFLCYIGAIIWCFLFNIDYTIYLYGFSSFILTFSWIFADTIKKVFICFIFVLIIRPFNIGDRVYIDNQNLKVCKIDLLHSSFYNDHRTLVLLPNDTLFSTQICNFAKSKDQVAIVNVYPCGVVEYEKVKSLEKELRTKIQKMDKYFTNLEFNSKLADKVCFFVNCNNNFQDDRENLVRKEKLIKLFDTTLKEIGINHKHAFEVLI